MSPMYPRNGFGTVNIVSTRASVPQSEPYPGRPRWLSYDAAVRTGWRQASWARWLSSARAGAEATRDLPVHFFTIVLNGEPFIRYHLDVFRALPVRWHWHIIEGVA